MKKLLVLSLVTLGLSATSFAEPVNVDSMRTSYCDPSAAMNYSWRLSELGQKYAASSRVHRRNAGNQLIRAVNALHQTLETGDYYGLPQALGNLEYAVRVLADRAHGEDSNAAWALYNSVRGNLAC